MKIFKYRAPEPMTWAALFLPVGAEILHVGIQREQLWIWAKVDPDAQLENRIFRTVPTGGSVPETSKHVGTVITDQFVWHLLEDIS